MAVAPPQTDPLLLALSELRSDLNRWLDAELQRLSEVARSSASTPALLSGVSISPENTSLPISDLPTDSAAATPPVLAEVPGATPASQADESRQRLDALAKHLDRRMRRARGDSEHP